MLFQQSRLDLVLLAQHSRRHGGYQGQGDDQTGQQGIGHGERQVGKQLPGDARDKHDGQEHADGGQGRGRHRPRHLLRAGDGGLDDVGALGPQTVNILNDHHGVIHQHTHRHGKAGQGDHVDGHAGEVHQHDGKDHADGDGAEGNKRGAQIPQEQEQHQDRKHRAKQQAVQDGVDDQVDIVALAHQGHEAQARVFLFQSPEARFNVVGGLGGCVGALLFKAQHDAVLAVELGVGFVPVVGEHDHRHVLQPHGVDAVNARVEQEKIFQRLLVGNLVAHGDHVFDPVLLRVSRGHGEILGGEDLRYHFHGDDIIQVGLVQRVLPIAFHGVQTAFDLA